MSGAAGTSVRMSESSEGGAGDLPFERIAAQARDRIRSDARLRRRLPGRGRLHLDRALPFLGVYRTPDDRADPGTGRLVTALSSYLVAGGQEPLREGLETVVAAVCGAARETLGDFLLLEVWSGLDAGRREERPPPEVRIHREPSTPASVVEDLVEGLGSARLRPANDGELGIDRELRPVRIVEVQAVAPPGLPPLPRDPDPGLRRVGLEVAPFYRGDDAAALHPRVLNALRNALAEVLERAIFTFSQERTSLDAPHYRALGRTVVGRRTRHVDRRLAEVHRAFDTLRQVTPVNTEEAWEGFRASGGEREPRLRYHPLSFDPEYVKRRLFSVPIERVEDPLLGFLFREKQEELDREITMLRDLGTPRFVHASVQLYGGAERELVATAREVLRRLPCGDEEREYPGHGGRTPGQVGAAEFVREAREEMDRYGHRHSAFEGRIEVRDDVTAGLMVSQGVLCVSRNLSVARNRVVPLLHHEIGTHVLTWFNGGRQPLRQLASGLAGYDPLQEGIAVLAEHLVGGLTRGRMRVLAGRVLGVRALLDGATFVETYRTLTRGYHFRPRAAFIITLRVHRGGGITKDAAYLRGLAALLEHLAAGGSLAPLLVGKLGASHIEIAQELVLRGVLDTPALRPRYLDDPVAMERLEACRGKDVLGLVEDILREQST